MITYAEARKTALARLPRPRPSCVALVRALGLVAAGGHEAPEESPPHDNSAMDGYAVIAADTTAAADCRPVRLRVKGVLAAGSVAECRVEPGTACKIMTGAAMPDGADAVVPIEQTDGGEDTVAVRAAVAPGQHVRARGEDVRRGDVLISEGDVLGPADLGSLASVGIARVRVWRRPKVAVLITGDELVDPGEPLPRGKIRNSNAASLCCQVIEAGGVPKYRGIAADDPAELRRKLDQAASSADFVLTTGGVSMGDFDYVSDVLADAGFQVHFHWVAQRPGAPLIFATRGDTLLFGLPGNPASVMICFELHVRPLIRRFMRMPDPDRRIIKGRLVERFVKRKGLMQAVRVIAEPVPGRDSGPWSLRLSGGQGSGILRSMALGNALALLPPEMEEVVPDVEVEALLIR